MGLLDSAGMQKLWTKVKALVQPYVKDASLDGNTLTFTKGTGETKSFTIEGGSASNTPSYSEGLTYQLTTDKTGYAVTNIGTCTDTDIIIPPIYNGLPVKEIFGWSNTTTIISVTLPNSIISMGNYVFKGCSNLIKIIIPDSVTTIGQDIFNECPNVTVYCEAKSKPEGWHSRWDMSARHVVWNAFDFIGVHEHIENDLSEYVTEAELEEKGYLTETEIDEKDYATKDYVNRKVSSISSGTLSGDSSIIDLGQQGRHKEAQQEMIDNLMRPIVADGCYLFKYWCDCYGNACLAVVLKRTADTVYIEGTVYDNSFSYREFKYRYDMGLTVDGCWKEIGSSNSIPFTYFTCYSNERTVRELIDQLASEGVDTTESITAVVGFSAMLSETFLCNLSHYYGDYYGCKFTDLTNLKTYYFEGESRSLSLYDNLSNGGTSSGGAGLSMPRIRLANHWQGEDGVTCNKESNEWLGSYIFSVEIMDGTVQEGDQLQICSLTNHKNSRGVRVRKPRRFSERVITAEDIEMLQYNPYLQILVEGTDLRELYRSCSSDGTLYRYPKYIRLRRPKYDEEGQETGATFSNVVCADVRLPVTFFYE